MNNTTIEFTEESISKEDINWLLRRYELLPQFRRGMIIDQAIANITLSENEYQAGIAAFERQHHITSPQAREIWLTSMNLTLQQMEDLALRPLKIQKFKVTTWGSKLQTYFSIRKPSLNAPFDEVMRQRLLDEQFENWLQAQVYISNQPDSNTNQFPFLAA
jgi:hypothetical protein